MEVLIDPIKPVVVRPTDHAPATRARYKVVGLMMLMGVVTYLDRVAISKMAPDIMRDLHLDKVQMGYVFSAFALAYAIFEIPSAWWADRTGTRTMLTRIVICWSAFTMATAAAFNLASMLVIRFLFGAGEAGAWPGMARTFSRWIPRKERGTIQGVFFAGAHLSGGLTPLLVTGLLTLVSWRAAFVMFGFLGIFWAIAWHRWFRDDPSQHASVNAAELEYIVSQRDTGGSHALGWAYWKKLFKNRNTLALCLIYFPNSFVFYFCITWLPTYLKERHGFEALSLGFFAGLPLLSSVLGDLLGGVLSDKLTARFGLKVGRCGVGIIGYSIASAALLSAALTTHPVAAALLIALAVCATMFTLASVWTICIEVSGDHTAVVSAAMNTAGQVGSLLCPLLVAYTVQKLGNWNISLYVMSGLFFLGVGCWALLDPHKPIFAKESPRPSPDTTAL